MKTSRTFLLRACALLAIALLIAGCYPKRVVWSPDGKHAAVLGKDGLYLSDPEGRLSELLVSNVSVAAWYPDSQRLAIVRVFESSDWTVLESMLPASVKERIARQGQAVLKEINAGQDFSTAKTKCGLSDRDANSVGVYLKSAEFLKNFSAATRTQLEPFNSRAAIIQIATLEGEKLSLSTILARDAETIIELRMSPSGKALAYVGTAENGDTDALYAVPADGSEPPKFIAEHVAYFPDWSADGQSLVFVKASGNPAEKDQVQLGSLSKKHVVSNLGKLEVQDAQDDLVGLIFYDCSKVRCLDDGRIIFSSPEATLPSSKEDIVTQMQLFALDPERQAGLTALIPRRMLEKLAKDMSFFEISPDRKRVSFGDPKTGGVAVLTLATGEVEVVQEPAEEELRSVPVWRSNSQLCYIALAKNKDGNMSGQVALWEAGKSKVISKDWPAAARKEFLDK